MSGQYDANWGQPTHDPFEPWSQAWGPWAPMMAPWAQMMRTWSEGMSGMVPVWGPMMSTWMAPFGSTANPPVYVAVTSKKPAEVLVDLRPGAYSGDLSVTRLEGGSLDATPPIPQPSIKSANGQFRVTVTVPGDQPVGHYHGSIVDGAHTVHGRVCVEVHAKDK